MNPRHVLIPTDFSDDAARPLEWVRDLGERVTLLHVVEDLVVLPSGAPLAPPVSVPGTAEILLAARQRIEKIAQAHPDAKVRVEVIEAGDVPRAIVEWARDNEVDMIALSTHGRTGFRRLILGSVAEAVLRRSSVPVLCFPQRGK